MYNNKQISVLLPRPVRSLCVEWGGGRFLIHGYSDRHMAYSTTRRDVRSLARVDYFRLPPPAFVQYFSDTRAFTRNIHLLLTYLIRTGLGRVLHVRKSLFSFSLGGPAPPSVCNPLNMPTPGLDGTGQAVRCGPLCSAMRVCLRSLPILLMYNRMNWRALYMLNIPNHTRPHSLPTIQPPSRARSSARPGPTNHQPSQWVIAIGLNS